MVALLEKNLGMSQGELNRNAGTQRRRTITKRGTRLQPMVKTMVSWTIAERPRATSVVRRRLAASTTSAGGKENVSMSSTVSNDCRKVISPSTTTKSDAASSLDRAWERREATTDDILIFQSDQSRNRSLTSRASISGLTRQTPMSSDPIELRSWTLSHSYLTSSMESIHSFFLGALC